MAVLRVFLIYSSHDTTLTYTPLTSKGNNHTFTKHTLYSLGISLTF